MKNLFIIILLLFVHVFANASVLKQDSTNYAVSSFGFGAGLDYGGIGIRLTMNCYKEFAVFLGMGSVMIGPGFNVGAMYRGSRDKQVRPTASVMYGYNAYISVKNASGYDKIYYGPSMGFGIEIGSKKKQDNYLHLEMILPLRDADFWDDLKAIETNPNISVPFDPFPILIGIGYHLSIK